MTLLNEWLHFTRPYWLLMLPISWLLLTVLRWHEPTQHLKTTVAKHLLPYINLSSNTSPWQKWLGLLCINSLMIGLAGISFDKQQTELYNVNQKTVFIVDQSLSMYATDIRPNRLTKSKQVLRDILGADIEGDLALVAYAGDAYVISPFTQDKSTLTHFLVALDPRIMPLYGSNLRSGIEDALTLVEPQDYSHTTFIVVADDLTSADGLYLTQQFANTGITLKLIAIGTEEGAPVSMPESQILRHNNQVVSPKTPISEMREISSNIDAEFYQPPLTPTQISNIIRLRDATQSAQKSDFSGVIWREQGHWFALPFLLWLAWQFRGGLLFSFFIILLNQPNGAQASPLDWFKTSDQKAQQAVNEGDWNKARQLFEDPKWRAASDYALESYGEAVNTLSPLAQTAEDFYNLGNSLALNNQLPEAIEAYNKALTVRPDFKEAQQNREYLEQYLANQQKDQPPQNSQDDPKSGDEQQQNNDSTDSQQDETNQSSAPSSDQSQQNKSSQKQDNDSQKQDNQNNGSNQKEDAQASASDIQQEDQQALNQWLRQIQDDPGTLLQRKLWYLHQERRNENRYKQEDGQQPW